MRTINIHEVKTHLSRLVDRAAGGEPFVIAEAGRPIVKLLPLDAVEVGAQRRLGFLAGLAEIPDGFDRVGSFEIEALFGSGG